MDKFREEVKQQLATLSQKEQLLFAVVICERLYPIYAEFTKISNWGESETLQEAIALIRQYIINDALFDDDEIQVMLDKVEANTPDTDDFSGTITSLALNACTSISSTLLFILDHDVENIADVATYARDTMDSYIQEKEQLDLSEPALAKRIEANELMRFEKEYQRHLLAKLRGVAKGKITDQIVNDLADRHTVIDFGILRN